MTEKFTNSQVRSKNSKQHQVSLRNSKEANEVLNGTLI